MGVYAPLVGDFHYNGHTLLNDHPACAEALAKYRINPGNVGKGSRRDEQFEAMISIAKRYNKPVRIGVNWGSLDQTKLASMMDENSKLKNPLSSDALMREALSLVEAGIATPDDIDDAVRYSFGFRYAAVGPMTQKEISGWDGMANAAKEIYPSLSNITSLPSKLYQLMENGKTGMKAGEGFRKWTPEEIQTTTESYSRRLKAAFDVLNMQ